TSPGLRDCFQPLGGLFVFVGLPRICDVTHNENAIGRPVVVSKVGAIFNQLPSRILVDDNRAILLLAKVDVGKMDEAVKVLVHQSPPANALSRIEGTSAAISEVRALRAALACVR